MINAILISEAWQELKETDDDKCLSAKAKTQSCLSSGPMPCPVTGAVGPGESPPVTRSSRRMRSALVRQLRLHAVIDSRIARVEPETSRSKPESSTDSDGTTGALTRCCLTAFCHRFVTY